MQSLIDQYISTFAQENTTTPAIVGFDDAITIVEKWAKKTFWTIEKIRKEYIPWIFLYEIPEDKSEFPISEVRRFIQDTSKNPYEWKHLYVLLGIDSASLEAMNALLKVLEDTPKHAVILLVVENRESLIETIHSRSIDMFSQKKRIIDTPYQWLIQDFFQGEKELWITTLFAMKPTREEALDILTLTLEYAPSEYLESIEQGFMDLFTTNESPRNILDIVFLQ